MVVVICAVFAFICDNSQEDRLLVVIAVEASCFLAMLFSAESNFMFSESMSAVFLLRTDKAKHEDNRQETTRIYNRKNYDKVAND